MKSEENERTIQLEALDTNPNRFSQASERFESVNKIEDNNRMLSWDGESPIKSENSKDFKIEIHRENPNDISGSVGEFKMMLTGEPIHSV